jgi:cell division protein ZapE
MVLPFAHAVTPIGVCKHEPACTPYMLTAATAKKLPPQLWYRQQTQCAGFQHDQAQQRAVVRLQRLWDELIEFKSYRNRPFMRTLGRRPPPRGVYLHGGVGRGKSMLMDSFFASLPYRRKRRVHFHHFMQEVHQSLTEHKGEEDPLRLVGSGVARKTRVLCLDEFHVNDIGDAMILSRLLEVLFEGGVVLVMTSNYRPDELYRHGLQRERFLPAIELIRRSLDLVEVDGAMDHRLRQLEKLQTYLAPADAAAEVRLEQAFHDLCPDRAGASVISVNGRNVKAKRKAPGAVWFDFSELCGTPRSQTDYLEIAREFNTVLLSGVPRMSAGEAAEARRFTWLVDIFYDHRVNLLLSAQVPAAQLYLNGPNSGEFSRTVSRLQEMGSREYLAQQHLA